MTYQHNPLLIIFPYLPDECGDNSCSCYCIPHRDADSIYSRMRIVTLEPSFHCSTCQPKEKLSIGDRYPVWNHIHKYQNGLCVTFLNYYTAIGKLFQEENAIHMKILTTDLMIDYIIITLKWRNKVMYFITMFDVVFQTLPFITDSKSFLSINYTPFLLISFILIYIYFLWSIGWCI